jgi:phosphatidylserine decarboxylase
MQYLLPQHAISRLVLRATRSTRRGFKNFLIEKFVRGFRPDMSDAVETRPLAYASFNEFFTRALRPGTRPLPIGADELACPVDGTVSECGAIENGQLLQAKGQRYSVGDLLAGRDDWASRFVGGSFLTIYLAPYNYHRIHMPWHGRLEAAWYVPGALFSVNATTAAAVPGLFARNERVVCAFTQDGLPWSLVLVGALNVGCMDTVWHGTVAPRRPRVVTSLPLQDLAAPLALERGAEMGRFNMGSTVVLLFPRGAVSFDSRIRAGQVVRMGERIGSVRDGAQSNT